MIQTISGNLLPVQSHRSQAQRARSQRAPNSKRVLNAIGVTALLAGIGATVAFPNAVEADEAQVKPSTQVPEITVISAARNGIINSDKTTVYVKLFSWVGAPEVLDVRVRATDWNGNEIYKRDTKVNFNGHWTAPSDLILKRYGPYEISVTLHRAGQSQPIRTEKTRLLRVVPVPRLSREQRRNSYIGVNTHAQPPWQSLAAIGIHWARDYSWGWLGYGENAPMAANGVPFAPVMQSATEAGVSLLPVMQRAFSNPQNTGYTNDTTLVANAYERLAKAFPLIEYWELDNEPEYGFVTQKLDLENYRPYIKAAAAGLRRAGNAQVVLAGTAGIQIEDTRSLVARDGVSLPVRDDLAVVNYHYYTGGLPVERARSNTNESGGQTVGTLLDSQRTINRIAHEAGKEAWLTEIGWDVTNGAAVGERLQAIYLPRVYLLSRWAETDKVFWYFDRDVAGSVQKYSTMGLFDTNWIARPSAAALAALSQQTALAKPVGSVDLGEDRWCIVFRRPGGSYVLAAWTLEGRHALPSQLASARAYDLFGNALANKTLSTEVAYFHMDALPAAWAAHVQTELVSQSIMPLSKGGTTTVTITAPHGEASWVSLPAGVTSSPWSRRGNVITAQLRAAHNVEAGALKVLARVTGRNWQRQWPITIEVKQAAVLKAGPYTPKQKLAAHITGVTPQKQAVRLNIPDGLGTVEAASGEISAAQTHDFTVVPATSARGPLPLTVQLASGARQIEWLRPAALDVAAADCIQVDGQLKDWPAKHRLDWKYFATDTAGFQPQAALAWSAQGLWLAVQMPLDPAAPTNAENFWDWTNFELFIESNDAPSQWGPQSHQFYFVPTKQGTAWRLIAGEYKRGAAIDRTTFDDKRLRTAAQVENGQITMEAFLPAAALSRAPQAGQTWRAAIAMRGLSRVGLTTNTAWPIPKDAALLQGSATWGTLRFIGP